MWYIKSGVNTGWYLKELELLQANMTVQCLKQKLKVFATTAKYGMIELKSGNKQELQKIDLLINVFVQYWKKSWTTCLDHSLLFIVFYWCEMSYCVILASTFKAFLCVQYHVAFTNDRNSGETEEKIGKTQDTKKKRKSETPPERQ